MDSLWGDPPSRISRALEICKLGFEKASIGQSAVERDYVEKVRSNLETMASKPGVRQSAIVDFFIESLKAAPNRSSSTAEGLWALYSRLGGQEALSPIVIKEAAQKLSELFVSYSDPTPKMDRALVEILRASFRHYPSEVAHILEFSRSAGISQAAGFHLRHLVYRAVRQLSRNRRSNQNTRRRLLSALMQHRVHGINQLDFIIATSQQNTLQEFLLIAEDISGMNPMYERQGTSSESDPQWALRTGEEVLSTYSWKGPEATEPLEQSIEKLRVFEQMFQNLRTERAELDALIVGLGRKVGDLKTSKDVTHFEWVSQEIDQIAFAQQSLGLLLSQKLEFIDLELSSAGLREPGQRGARLKLIQANLRRIERDLSEGLYDLHELLHSEVSPAQKMQILRLGRFQQGLIAKVVSSLLPRVRELRLEDGTVGSETERLVRSLHRLQYSAPALEFGLTEGLASVRQVEKMQNAIEKFRARGAELSLLPLETVGEILQSPRVDDRIKILSSFHIPPELSFTASAAAEKKIRQLVEDVSDAESSLGQLHALETLDMYTRGILVEQEKAAKISLSMNRSERERFVAAREAFRMEGLRLLIRDRLSGLLTSPSLRRDPGLAKEVHTILRRLRPDQSGDNAWRVLGPSLSLRTFRQREEHLQEMRDRGVDFADMTVEEIEFYALPVSGN